MMFSSLRGSPMIAVLLLVRGRSSNRPQVEGGRARVRRLVGLGLFAQRGSLVEGHVMVHELTHERGARGVRGVVGVVRVQGRIDDQVDRVLRLVRRARRLRLRRSTADCLRN
jgi:hypothetical protein